MTAPTQGRLPGMNQPKYAPDMTVAERFESFHELNPWVADELERLADERLFSGVSKFGVKALVERLRWDWTGGQRDATVERWRLNNSYTSHYARLLIRRRPEFRNAIELRELKT